MTQMNRSTVAATVVKTEPTVYKNTLTRWHRWTALRHLPDDTDEPLYGDSHSGENWAFTYTRHLPDDTDELL